MRNFFYNFVASVIFKLPPKFIPEKLEWWVVDGCEKYTPKNHRWREDPMF